MATTQIPSTRSCRLAQNRRFALSQWYSGELLSDFIVYCLLIVFLFPDYVHDLGNVTRIAFDVLRAFGGLIAVVLFMIQRKRSNTAKAIVVYITFIGIVTICSFSSANIVRFIAIYADIFAIVILADFLIAKDPHLFLRVMHKLLMAGLILNCISVAVCPDGLLQVANEAGAYGPYYLYGYDNGFILLYLPTVAVVFLYEKYIKGKRRGGIETLIVLLLCVASLTYLHSAASMIAFGFIIVFYLLLRCPKHGSSLIGISWLIYCILATMLITGTLLPQDSQFVSSIGKESSLFVRETMWSRAIEMIEVSPLFGTGVLSTSEMRGFFGYATLHNTLINLLFWSGILGLLLFSGIAFAMQREMRAASDHYDSAFLSCLFIAFLLASFTGCLELESGIYLLFLMIGNYKRISNAYAA